MIVNGNHEIRNVSGISDADRIAIRHFLQGAVYCWCKNKKNEWLSLRELMGGDNFYWNATPLISLYNKHEYSGSNDAIGDAAKDAGWILKEVIEKDPRKFEVIKAEMTNKYRWIPDE
jgi:hypothetical protein